MKPKTPGGVHIMTDQFFQHGTTPSPEPLIIRELQLKFAVYGWLLATEVQVRKTINGKPFVDLTLRDPHGSEIIGRYFDPPENEALIPREGSVVLVEGVVDKFNNRVHIRLTRASTDETVPSHLFLPGTRYPSDLSLQPGPGTRRRTFTRYRQIRRVGRAGWTGFHS
jgi:hypothetical protein